MAMVLSVLAIGFAALGARRRQEPKSEAAK